MPGDILELTAVTRRFPGFLLDGVTFSVRPGSEHEAVAVEKLSLEEVLRHILRSTE